MVLAQVAGKARPRKLGKLHARVGAALSKISLTTRPSFASIPRASNGHADALSRAAVDAASTLHGGAVLALARGDELTPALTQFERALTRRGT